MKKERRMRRNEGGREGAMEEGMDPTKNVGRDSSRAKREDNGKRKEGRR